MIAATAAGATNRIRKSHAGYNRANGPWPSSSSFRVSPVVRIQPTKSAMRRPPTGKNQLLAGAFGTLDYMASNWFLPVGGLLIALFVGWILTTSETRKELEEGHGPMARLYPAWLFLIRFVAPAAVAAMALSTRLMSDC